MCVYRNDSRVSDNDGCVYGNDVPINGIDRRVCVGVWCFLGLLLDFLNSLVL